MRCVCTQENYPPALQCCKKVHEILNHIYGANSLQVARLLVRMGEIYYLQDGYRYTRAVSVSVVSG
jgi:hypothetical protein